MSLSNFPGIVHAFYSQITKFDAKLTHGNKKQCEFNAR